MFLEISQLKTLKSLKIWRNPHPKKPYVFMIGEGASGNKNKHEIAFYRSNDMMHIINWSDSILTN